MKGNRFSKTFKFALFGMSLFIVTVHAEVKTRYETPSDYPSKFPASTRFHNEGQEGYAPEWTQEISEAELLEGLDKEGRSMYYSLSEKEKKLVRSLAVKSSDYKEVVKAAAQRDSNERMKGPDTRLHNGMDRLLKKKHTKSH